MKCLQTIVLLQMIIIISCFSIETFETLETYLDSYSQFTFTDKCILAIIHDILYNLGNKCRIYEAHCTYYVQTRFATLWSVRIHKRVRIRDTWIFQSFKLIRSIAFTLMYPNTNNNLLYTLLKMSS